MKSIQIKDKMRKKTEKLRRVKLSTRNTSTKPDLSILRKPIDTSASNFYQVSDLLESGTDEVKSILSYECNILYECRTCRSLFRSIINLISHKREYCKEKFHVAFGKEVWNNCNSHNESVIHLYETEQTINKDDTSTKNDRILRSQSKFLQSQSKEASKKDLSTIVDMLNKKRKEENEASSISNEDDDNDSTSNKSHIYLESISTNCSAVYQTVKTSNAANNTVDLMKVQVAELQSIANKKVTLDGQVLENQAEKSDDADQTNVSGKKNELSAPKSPPNNLSCTICKSKFSTKKTLHVHMKVLHTPHRKCYLCPCCSSTFANTWSVHRHLYKVHRKTNEQVRKLRLEIQEKVLDNEMTPGGLKNTRTSKASAGKKTTVKNCDIFQGSEDYVESNVQPVSGSKRRKRATRKKALPIDYQIAEDDDVTSSQSSETSSDSTSSNILSKPENRNAIIDAIVVSPSKTDISDIKSDKCTSSSSENDKETSETRIQDFYSSDKEDANTLENNYPFECNSMHNNNDPSTIKSIKQDISNKEPLLDVKDVPDKDLQLPLINDIGDMRIDDVQEGEDGKLSGQCDEKKLTDVKERNTKDPLVLIEEKIAKIADFQKIRCLLCRRKFISVPNLRRHVAMHIGWNRYRCNLCEYKCFTKCDCVLHCNKVHNAQNDREMLAEMVVEISPNEYTCDEKNMTDERVDDADDVDVPKSTDQRDVLAVLNSYLDDWNYTCAALENEIVPGNEQQVVESQETVANPGTRMIDFTTVSEADMAEFMTNTESEKLSPDVKRMIMEVIFGSDTSVTEQTNTNASSTSEVNDAKESVNEKSGGASTDNSKEESCSILSTLKHQRPMRNRIKPLSDDFIYDLEQIAYRKESALSHNSEPLRKKARLNK